MPLRFGLAVVMPGERPAQPEGHEVLLWVESRVGLLASIPHYHHLHRASPLHWSRIRVAVPGRRRPPWSVHPWWGEEVSRSPSSLDLGWVAEEDEIQVTGCLGRKFGTH